MSSDRLAAYRVADVRAAEDAALKSTAGDALMQQAATAVAVAAASELRDRTGGVSGRRVVLLVGAGNNGGDALWAGVRLRARGVAVTAILTSDKPHAEGLAAFRRSGGPVTTSDAALKDADLVIDGLLGLGGRPGLREPARSLVAAIPPRAAVVAVDLPSGVDPDTGELPSDGAHVTADVTVTFGGAKPCLLLPPASAAAGRVVPVDLGFALGTPLVERLGTAALAGLWPTPENAKDKYRRGVLGVVAGSAGYPGAAVLCVSGAVRAGLGMLRYQGPDPVADAVRSAWPEVVVGEGRVQAWVLGPGVDPGAAPDQVDIIRTALSSGEPAVLDAGGTLTWLQTLTGENRNGDFGDPARFLLTPHAGELATLMGRLGTSVERAEVEARPYHYASLAASQTGATVLLKGNTTLIVRPDGVARSQAEATPWLATAGAGDVLAGIAGALLSAGLSPFDAGAVAASVHGQAARLASSGGPIVSADVADALPAVVTALLAP